MTTWSSSRSTAQRRLLVFYTIMISLISCIRKDYQPLSALLFLLFPSSLVQVAPPLPRRCVRSLGPNAAGAAGCRHCTSTGQTRHSHPASALPSGGWPLRVELPPNQPRGSRAELLLVVPFPAAVCSSLPMVILQDANWGSAALPVSLPSPQVCLCGAVPRQGCPAPPLRSGATAHAEQHQHHQPDGCSLRTHMFHGRETRYC